MKRFVILVMLVTLFIVGCKRKEQVQIPSPPPPPAVVAPVAAVPSAVPSAVVPTKQEPTPGTFAAKKAAGPAPEEKPASFAKKVAKPKPSGSTTGANEGGGAKSFAKKKPN
jgi:hypothetical protein